MEIIEITILQIMEMPIILRTELKKANDLILVKKSNGETIKIQTEEELEKFLKDYNLI